MEEHSVDVLAVGSGAAGLGAATIVSCGAFASGAFGRGIEEHIRKAVGRSGMIKVYLQRLRRLKV
jgi:thioredoxin reductase